jgi:hypothetical protein
MLVIEAYALEWPPFAPRQPLGLLDWPQSASKSTGRDRGSVEECLHSSIASGDLERHAEMPVNCSVAGNAAESDCRPDRRNNSRSLW